MPELLDGGHVLKGALKLHEQLCHQHPLHIRHTRLPQALHP